MHYLRKIRLVFIYLIRILGYLMLISGCCNLILALEYLNQGNYQDMIKDGGAGIGGIILGVILLLIFKTAPKGARPS